MYTPSQKKPRKRKPARQVGEFIGKVMEPVLSRRSGMNVDLITAWPELVGAEFADFTRPEKINWPNRAYEDDPFKPGTLIVACDGARAIYFQHELSTICERVNVFFGFAAITKIKIVQKPVTGKRGVARKSSQQKPVLDANEAARLNKILDRIEDPVLREKLEKLGKGLISRSRNPSSNGPA